MLGELLQVHSGQETVSWHTAFQTLIAGWYWLNKMQPKRCMVSLKILVFGTD
jgi:hypothetical protein